MADATIIVGKLDSKEMEKSIDQLIKTINNKMLDAATSFDDGVTLMEQSLQKFATKAKTTVTDIKDTFKQLGTTFDDFAKAMQKAAAAANSMGGGGHGGGSGSSGGSGGSSGGGSSATANTIGGLKEEISLQQQKVDAQVRGTAQLQIEVDKHRELQRQLKEETKSTEQRNKELASTRIKNAMSMPTSTLDEAQKKLRLMEIYQRRYANTTQLSEQQQNRLAQAINRTKAQIERMRPMDWTRWAAMSEKSIDDVAKKMQALRRLQIDPSNATEVRRLGEEYQRLGRRQADLMGKGVQLTKSNNYLAQSFGYIRNRIVYAFTLGALTNFMKKLYDVRGEYEMLERSLGILIGSMERGTQIFNELNEMAIKSPFTLIELGTAAKQLSAYNFTADELVDTTRRLADISAALGVPMERLTYNLGQIKAQGALTARDARDFANAGLAIVPMLAQMYTESKRFGDQQVTTAQVYDMMSKKMVSYRDVLSVLYRITDEGGKFFDFQAKQAGTLKVQIANLTLAFNNMLNDIGKEHQDAMAIPLQAMRWVFQHWRDIYNIIKSVIIVLGAYKAQAVIAFAVTQIQSAVAAYRALGGAIGIARSAQVAFNTAFASNPIGFVATLIASAIAAYTALGGKVEEVSYEVEAFGESGAKALEKFDTYTKILQNTDKDSKVYQQTLRELNELLQEFGAETVKEGENYDENNKKRERAIELIKQESAERQYANQMAAGTERYNKQVEQATQKLNADLKNAMTSSFGFVSANSEIRKNADAISSIVQNIVQSNISLIADKTGEEYQKGMDEIYKKINEAMEAIGISQDTRMKAWVDNGLFYHGNILNNYIKTCVGAKNANIDYTASIKAVHDKETQAAASTMTLQQRIEAYERALQKPTDDTYKLYTNIANLVRDYAKQHNIDFNVRFKAEVPAWMNSKELPELQALARRFGALAQTYKNGANVNGVQMTQEDLMQRALLYAQAARDREDEMQGEAAREKELEKQRKKEEAERRRAEAAARADARRAHTEQVQQENEVAKALKDEISLVKEMQSNYDKLRKAGINNTDAINVAAMGYEDTIARINAVLVKYGINEFKATDFAGKDVNDLLNLLTTQRSQLLNSGKVKTDSLKTLDVEIQRLNIEAKTYNMKKITDGLNNELGRIKDEYELSVEMDANPELASVFKDMFDIDASGFPQTISEYQERVQAAFDKIRQASGYTTELNIFKASADDWQRWAESVDISEEKLKEIKQQFDGAVDVAKKWARDVVKQTKDLEYKLADTNGKIAIEEEKLANLRKRLANETNEEQRRLLELQIKDQELAIEKLQQEIFELLPTYKAVFGGIAEHSAYMTRKLAQQLKKMLEDAELDDEGDGYIVTDPITGQKAPLSKKERGRQLDKVNKELLKSQSSFAKIREAFTKGDDDVIDYSKGIELVGEELQKLGDLVNAIGDITASLGMSEEGQEIVGDFANTLAGLGQAAQGYAKIQSGDVIGGSIDMIQGTWKAIGTWFDNSNKKITREIEKSKKSVRDLELAYKDLQYAVENSLGANEIYARRATLANKQLQLQEKERQLELERSRKKKDRDEDAIATLEGEVTDLRNEITTLTSDVANTLLGSDIKSAAEDFVNTWVSAWRQGNDTMDALGEKFDSMIDNMIAKSLASKVVAKRLQPIYDIIDTITGTETDEQMREKLKEIKTFIGDGTFAKDIDTFLTELYGYLGIGQGSGTNKTLSALQQGIQGITEETAGALEAYMNGVSQQVYLQSDLLVQIRDAVVTMDNEVTMATQAQMLLQLQNTYTLMQTMNALMNGWTTPSGNGIRVELLN